MTAATMTLPTSVELKRAAWRDVRDCDGALVRLLPGIGTEIAHPDTVALVEAIVGRPLRFRPDWRTGVVPTVPQSCNVALLRASMRRWAYRQRNTVAALVSGYGHYDRCDDTHCKGGAA